MAHPARGPATRCSTQDAPPGGAVCRPHSGRWPRTDGGVWWFSVGPGFGQQPQTGSSMTSPNGCQYTARRSPSPYPRCPTPECREAPSGGLSLHSSIVRHLSLMDEDSRMCLSPYALCLCGSVNESRPHLPGRANGDGDAPFAEVSAHAVAGDQAPLRRALCQWLAAT